MEDEARRIPSFLKVYRKESLDSAEIQAGEGISGLAAREGVRNREDAPPAVPRVMRTERRKILFFMG